jgi:hypothetical protein
MERITKKQVSIGGVLGLLVNIGLLISFMLTTIDKCLVFWHYASSIILIFYNFYFFDTLIINKQLFGITLVDL